VNEPSLSPVLVHGPATPGAHSSVPPFFQSMIIEPLAIRAVVIQAYPLLHVGLTKPLLRLIWSGR
jgi:hypothetical protein